MAVNMALTSLLVCSDAQAVQVLTRILQDLGISVDLVATFVWPELELKIGTSMLFWSIAKMNQPQSN
jgi:hypothetical protein